METKIYAEMSNYLFALGDALRKGNELIDLMDENWDEFVTKKTEDKWSEVISELQNMTEHLEIAMSIIVENTPEQGQYKKGRQ